MSNSDIEEGNESHTNNRSDTRRRNNTDTSTKNELKLYKAALSNDWEKAKRLYRKSGMEYGVRITSRGETALHIAALAGHVDFVENLVKEMKDTDIRIEMKSHPREERGDTAFHCASMSGNVKIAKAIIRDNLAMARGSGNRLPIQMAASKGNKEMVRYLYGEIGKNLLDPPFADDCRYLLTTLIHSNIYDVAFELANDLTKEKREAEKIEEEALKALAPKPLSLPGFFAFSKHAKDKRLQYISAIKLVLVLWDSVSADKERVSALIKSKDENLLLEAAKHGNFEFLSILIAKYPPVLFTYDHNRYTIFHHAILNRHVDIFKLINIGSVKTIVTSFKDEQGNNMLHLAGKLPPSNRLKTVPGAALQLQLELLWFEEVKKVLESHEVTQKNSSIDRQLHKMQHLYEKMEKMLDEHISHENIEPTTERLFEELMKVRKRHNDLKTYNHIPPGRLQQLFEEIKKVIEQPELSSNDDQGERKDTPRDFLYRRILLLFKEMEKAMEQNELNQIHNLKEEHTPHEVFVKEHGDLFKEGEHWMRDTANSCFVVAALITTIAFAAAITVPGGNGGDGYPQFSSKLNFKAFAVADSVSLIFSATSLLSFLAILTSRYTMDDFRRSLPNKLLIGLSTLLVSYAAMMVAFVLSIFIIFRGSHGLLPILVAATSFVPIIFFTCVRWSLFVDVIYTTYASCLLFKSRKDPYLLLKEQKRKRKSRFSLR